MNAIGTLTHRRVYDILFEAYGARGWWPARSPYEMMMGAILTQNTNWTNVERALVNFGERLSPSFVEDAALDALKDIIRPSGFYNQKAPRLKALTAWYKGYGWDIERVRAADAATLRTQLLAINGVGRETADSVLLYAALKPVFVIDKYTRRLFGRLGFRVPDDYDDFAKTFTTTLPEDVQLYNEYHALIVEHSKRHCAAKARCEGCPLGAECARVDA